MGEWRIGDISMSPTQNTDWFWGMIVHARSIVVIRSSFWLENLKTLMVFPRACVLTATWGRAVRITATNIIFSITERDNLKCKPFPWCSRQSEVCVLKFYQWSGGGGGGPDRSSAWSGSGGPPASGWWSDCGGGGALWWILALIGCCWGGGGTPEVA